MIARPRFNYDMAARCLFGVHVAHLNFSVEESDHIQLSDKALAKINRILFGERIDWLIAMRAQNDTIAMVNEGVTLAASVASVADQSIYSEGGQLGL
jgi:hypothetical protein